MHAVPKEQTIHNAKVSKGLSEFSPFPDWLRLSNPLRARLLTNNKDGLTADAAIKNVTVVCGVLVTAKRTPHTGTTTNWAVFSKCSSRFLAPPASCRLDSNSVRPSVLHTLRPTEGTAEVVMRTGAACGSISPCLPFHGVPVT